MSARCWITPGEFGGTKVLYDEADADAWRKAGFDVTGPWVLEAQQPQGAVSLLDDLADVLADVRAGVVPADGSVVRDVLNRAIRHVNGGSSTE